MLTNPVAGRGRARRAGAAALRSLRQAGFDVRELVGRDADESAELARQCVRDGVESLVACGGDGTVHLAVQALAGTDTALGVIPAGSGNDVARTLGIPRGNPLAAADVVVASRQRRIDLARCGSTYYVTVLAAGFDALVNERANAMTWPRGQMRYTLATLAELGALRPRRYLLSVDGVERRLDAVVIAVGNGPSFGGGLRITHGADLGDGLLDVVVIGPMSRVKVVRTYPRLFNGTHVRIREYQHHRTTAVTVAAPGIVAYADGERLGALPVTVEAVPSALRVLAPA